jgi:hypothetical protein
MKQPDFANRLVEILSNFQQFFVRNPHSPRGSRAAVATLSTRELKPFFVPRLSFRAGFRWYR